MKSNKINTTFTLTFILYVIFFICCLPSYVCLKHIDIYLYDFKWLWEFLDYILFRIKCINHFSNLVLFKIPDFTVLISVIINIANMSLGFAKFKKNWWYYVLLLISFIMSLMLLDYWHIRYTLP